MYSCFLLSDDTSEGPDIEDSNHSLDVDHSDHGDSEVENEVLGRKPCNI